MLNLDTSYYNKRFWPLTNTAPYTQPVRYTKDDIVVVKSERIGAPAEPYSVEFLLHIKGTEHYVALSYENEGAGKWFYDLKHAKLASPEGKPLRGKQAKLPTPVSDLLDRVWGSQSLGGNAPQKIHG